MLLGIHIEVITFVVKPISFNCPSFIQKAPVAFHFKMLTFLLRNTEALDLKTYILCTKKDEQTNSVSQVCVLQHDNC